MARAGRERLFAALDGARARGTARRVRHQLPPAWLARSRQCDKVAFRAALARADMVLASVEDLSLLFGEEGLAELPTTDSRVEVVLKLAEPAVRIFHGNAEQRIPAEPVEGVVDTTAAGDSFAAAYLAARLFGAEPADAARAGHRLAGAVVRHRGAIIPRSAMPDFDEITNLRGKATMTYRKKPQRTVAQR